MTLLGIWTVYVYAYMDAYCYVGNGKVCIWAKWPLRLPLPQYVLCKCQNYTLIANICMIHILYNNYVQIIQY